MATLSGVINIAPSNLAGDIESVSVDFEGSVVAGVAPYPEYEGAYEVTPSQSTQVLYTQNKLVTTNITINPIPSNYGLISWDGSNLKVS